MPRRIGQTVWVLCLTESNYGSFGKSSHMIAALPGEVHLLTDVSVFRTLGVLEKHGMTGLFEHIISRGRLKCNDFTFWKNISRVLRIRRCKRCVLIDTNACSIVASKLIGWIGCLVASPDNVAPEKLAHRTSNTQLGRGACYDTRFSTMENALRHYIFGSISQSA